MHMQVAFYSACACRCATFIAVLVPACTLYQTPAYHLSMGSALLPQAYLSLSRVCKQAKVLCDMMHALILNSIH